MEFFFFYACALGLLSNSCILAGGAGAIALASNCLSLVRAAAVIWPCSDVVLAGHAEPTVPGHSSQWHRFSGPGVYPARHLHLHCMGQLQRTLQALALDCRDGRHLFCENDALPAYQEKRRMDFN